MSDSFNVFDLFDFEQSKFSVAVLAALGEAVLLCQSVLWVGLKQLNNC